MRLLYDTVHLELQKEEWEKDKRKDIIIRPDQAAEREDGKLGEKIPWHYFKVIEVGPDCKYVKAGDRVFPRPPDLNHQPQLIPVIVWVNGVKTVRYEIAESNLGGIE